MPAPKSLPGQEIIPIVFPALGPWLQKGKSRQIGPLKKGFCSGDLHKTPDNMLYVFLEIATWHGKCIKEFMPLRVPDEGVSALKIDWTDSGVRLQQDEYPAIEAKWKQLR